MDKKWPDEAQTGFRGQGAIVEIMRRVRDALLRQQRATKWLTWALVNFGGCERITCTWGQAAGHQLAQVNLTPYRYIFEPCQGTTMPLPGHKPFIKKELPLGL